VTVTDRAGLQDSVRVAVHVTPVNDAPVVARVPDLIVRGDSTIAFNLARYVSDVDDTTSGIRADIRPMEPTVSDPTDERGIGGIKSGPAGSAHFDVDSLMNVRISITGRFQCANMPVIVRVSDPQGAMGTDTLFLSVVPNALPPVIQAIADTIAVPGQPYMAYARVASADAEAAHLAYSLEGPAWLTIDSTGRISGIPPRASEDSVLVIVIDSWGASDSLRFRIVTRGVAAADVPTDYVLYQNYPNPFNPSTTLRFGLPEPSRVTAEVFNILGQRVATVISSELREGYHSVQWVPENLASGAYIIVLEAHGLVSAGRDARMIRKVSLVR
jgi:hypothetical protein